MFGVPFGMGCPPMGGMTGVPLGMPMPGGPMLDPHPRRISMSVVPADVRGIFGDLGLGSSPPVGMPFQQGPRGGMPFHLVPRGVMPRAASLFGMPMGGQNMGRAQTHGQVFDPSQVAHAQHCRAQSLGPRAGGPGNFQGMQFPGQQLRGGGSLSHKYRKIKELQKGGMAGAVSLIENRSDGKLYVEKKVRTDGGLEKRGRAELKALKMVQGHPHLNQLIEYEVLNHGQITVILEYCDNGSLEDTMKEAFRRGRRGFTEVAIWDLAEGVASGLAFLHNGIRHPGRENPRSDWNTICHLDLKPCNIFLSSSGGHFGQPRVVLADFGCAVTLADIQSGREDAHLQACGTPVWYPPEGIPGQVAKTAYGTKTDIFMLGVTIQAICKIKMEPDRHALQTNTPCGRNYSTALNSMVSQLTQADFPKRPPAREIAVAAKERVQRTVGSGSGAEDHDQGREQLHPLMGRGGGRDPGAREQLRRMFGGEGDGRDPRCRHDRSTQGEKAGWKGRAKRKFWCWG